MKKRCILSIISLLLTLVLLLAQVTLLISCTNESESTDSGNGNCATDDTPDDSGSSGNSGNENGDDKPNGDENVTPGDELVLEKTTPLYAENASDFKTYDTQGKPVFNANFCKDFEKVNIPPAEYALKKTADDAPDAKVSFIWNSRCIRYVVTTDKANSISVSIGDYSVILGTDALENGTTLTRTISLDTIGISIQDIGQLIEAKITVKSGDLVSESDGYIQIADYKICFNTAGEDKIYFTKVSSTVKDESVAGFKFENGKIKLYDTYANGDGAPNTKLVLQKKNILDLQNATKNFVIEAELTIDAMPVYSPTYLTNSSAAGLNFNVCNDSSKPSHLLTLINTSEGILVMAIGDGAYYLANTGKKVGDSFHFAAALSPDGSTVISIDGQVVAAFENASALRTDYASKSVTVVWLADGNEKKSDSDNMDITVDSLMVYFDQSKSPVNTLSVKDLFGGKNQSVAEQTYSVFNISTDLDLASDTYGEKYNLNTKLYWSSSDEELVSSEGKLTRPEGNGKLVYITLYTLDGNVILNEKTFIFFASGIESDNTVLTLNNDRNPFTGSATASDTVFILNSGMNSAVYDMGKVTDINRATVKSFLSMGLVSKNFIGLYYSSDNVNYSRIDSFSMLQVGNSLYFYNFNVEARYLKVRMTTGGLENSGVIVNTTSDLLTAEYSDAPLLSSGEFAKTANVTLKNEESKTVYDKVFSLTLTDMGISASDLKSDLSDIRFMHDGAYLPHYLTGTTFYVRVLEMSSKESITVKVLYGNENAESVSDGNETFEIQYGEKFAKKKDEYGWFNTVLTAPNNDLLRIVSTTTGFGVYRSTDGGLTWSGLKKIPGSEVVTQKVDNLPYASPYCECGGTIVDKENGRIFLICQRIDKEVMYNQYKVGYQLGLCYIFLSTDNGETWSLLGNPTGTRTETSTGIYDNIDDDRGIPRYTISYSDGISLSCEDGEGPNVDYVFGLSEIVDQESGAMNTTVIYSKDGGKSWIFSNSTIHYEGGNISFREDGCSEDTLLEQEDGTLIIYTRCQISGVDHFVVSKSYDRGVTWEKPSLSNIYTSNTQPIIDKLADGTPVILWAGNNVLGGRSYMRFPLNLAYSTNDGETFTGIQDLSFGTIIDKYFSTAAGYGYHNNPDITFVTYKGEEIAYVVSTQNQMYVIGVDDYLHKQNGAFDSFEFGAVADGWIVTNGGIGSSSLGATDGALAMTIGQNTIVSRSITYMEKGSIEFDYHISSFGSGQYIELQAAFNNEAGATPISGIRAPIALYIDKSGKVSYVDRSGVKNPTSLSLQLGNNTLSISFDGNERSSTLTVNGKSEGIGFSGDDTYICYIAVFTKQNTFTSLDRFVAVKKA